MWWYIKELQGFKGSKIPVFTKYITLERILRESFYLTVDGRLESRSQGYQPVAPRPISCRPSVHRLCSYARHLQRRSTPSDMRDPCCWRTELWSRNGRQILPSFDEFHIKWRVLLHAAKLRHGTNGFTYFTSEGRHAEDFFALKNPTASAAILGITLRYEPHTLVAQTLTTLHHCFPNCGPRTTGGPRVLPLWSS
jgi:hypothetical protein